jgi:pyrroloquinoline quinone (PQQ) biosynthesis protein C
MTTLRRTVPFLARSSADQGTLILLIDSAELPLAATCDPRLSPVLRRPLSLGPARNCIRADEVERLVEGQYQAAVEYIYGHRVWQRIREGGHVAALHSYLLESRHYLAAASYRMASGITDALRPSEIVRLQAHHVAEEAYHDIYFENGLAVLDIPRELIRHARPSPVTVEWIHLMRTVAAYSPLAAAICSGLLEYTAGDQGSVAGWHAMLHERGLLPKKTVDAIFEHVETDLGLGHGNNWRAAIRAAKVVPAEELADWLNAVSLVAEMIVRWLDSLEEGLAAQTVGAAVGLVLEGPEPVLGGETDGLPVWPADVYSSYAHGPRDGSTGLQRVLALSYAYSGRAAQRAGFSAASPAAVARNFAEDTARDWDGHSDEVALEKLVESWMTAIDGHELWRRLTEEPTMPLVHGWMVENYHYVAGIWQHCGGAVAACPDPVIRAELVRHLIEEFNHGKMFSRGITSASGDEVHGLTPDQMRPLPTTVAFIGTLRELAQRDWKAYILALSFLQLTLSTAGNSVHVRHEQFYQALFGRLPGSEQLVSAMRRHDAEDTRLGHSDDTRQLLRLLAARHALTRESVAAAALVPQLAWSFLDGIARHYQHGAAATLQRAGWHVDE